MDNVMIERLWRSLKYECLYLREIETGSELCRVLAWWFGFYNNRRPHKTFDGRKPMEIYQAEQTRVCHLWFPPDARHAHETAHRRSVAN